MHCRSRFTRFRISSPQDTSASRSSTSSFDIPTALINGASDLARNSELLGSRSMPASFTARSISPPICNGFRTNRIASRTLKAERKTRRASSYSTLPLSCFFQACNPRTATIAAVIAATLVRRSLVIEMYVCQICIGEVSGITSELTRWRESKRPSPYLIHPSSLLLLLLLASNDLWGPNGELTDYANLVNPVRTDQSLTRSPCERARRGRR